MYGLRINFCCCSTIKTAPIFDIYILPNIGGIFYFFSAFEFIHMGANCIVPYSLSICYLQIAIFTGDHAA